MKQPPLGKIFSLLLALLTLSAVGFLLYKAYYKPTSGSEQEGVLNTAFKAFDIDRYQANRTIDEEEFEESGEVEGIEGETETNVLTEEQLAEVEIKRSGWIPSWSYNAGVASLKAESELPLSQVMPVWYAINAQGELTISRPTNYKDLMNYAKANGIVVTPTISSFNADDFRATAGDLTKAEAHAMKLISEVEKFGYDGIDLDYEMIYATEGDEYMHLLKTLSRELKARKKILSVTVLAKWSDLPVYSTFKETRGVQQWDQIVNYADQLRIMTYDYTSTTAPAGPISPYEWLVQVVEYAKKKAPPEKIWLGVNLYGYEWGLNEKTLALNYSQLQNRIPNFNEAEMYDEETKEGYAEYQCRETNTTCKTYFMSSKGLQERENLAKKYGIAGVTFWKLGNEGVLLK